MPSRLSIIHTNAADAATLSVSPTENASWPVANLKSQMRSEVLRTAGVSAQQVRAVWAAAVPISAVALCQHNLTAAATWRIRLYSDAAFTAQVYDSGWGTAYDSAGIGVIDTIAAATFREYKNSVAWFSATNALSMTIDLSDAGNADGYLSAARLFAGSYVELTRNFDWDHTLTLVSQSAQASSVGGSTLSVWGGATKRELELPMSMLPSSDREFIFDLIRAKDVNGDFFLSAWPGRGGKETRDYQGWAKLKSWQGMKRPLLNWYGSSVTVVFC